MNIKVNYGQSVHGKEEICAVTEVLKNSTQMGRNTRKEYSCRDNSLSAEILASTKANA